MRYEKQLTVANGDFVMLHVPTAAGTVGRNLALGSRSRSPFDEGLRTEW
jgi:hypothetical protein